MEPGTTPRSTGRATLVTAPEPAANEAGALTLEPPCSAHSPGYRIGWPIKINACPLTMPPITQEPNVDRVLDYASVCQLWIVIGKALST